MLFKMDEWIGSLQTTVQEKHKILMNVIEELGLTDPWRDKNPLKRDYTFYSNPHDSYSRIDFFLISKQHIHKVWDCKFESITISDHAPVKLTIDMGKEQFFKYWRLNTSILTDKEILNELSKKLEEYFMINDNNEVTPSILWM